MCSNGRNINTKPPVHLLDWITELDQMVLDRVPYKEILAYCLAQHRYHLSPSQLARYRKKLLARGTAARPACSPTSPPPGVPSATDHAPNESPPDSSSSPISPPPPPPEASVASETITPTEGVSPADFHQLVVQGAIAYLQEGGRVTVSEAQRSIKELVESAQSEQHTQLSWDELVRTIREEVYGL